MFVVPAPGALVRDPELIRDVFPAEGREVPRTEYWLRRLRDGDVSDDPAEIAAAQAKAAPAEQPTATEEA